MWASYMLFVSLLSLSLKSLAQPLLWSHTYGGCLHDRGYAIVQASGGGYVFAGTTESYGSGLEDCWLVKMDSMGDTVWCRTVGGADYDWTLSVTETLDGDLIAVGATHTLAVGWADAWLIKMNAAGELIWTRTICGQGNDELFHISRVHDNGFILAGCTDSYGNRACDGWLIRLDAQGDSLWSRFFGGPYFDELRCVEETSDGGFVAAGITGNDPDIDMWLVKTDSLGNLLWQQTYGGTAGDAALSMHQTHDGGYILAGYTRSYGVGGDDAYVVKTNENGEVTWSQTYGGVFSDLPRSIIELPYGGYLFSGATESVGAGSFDFWLVKVSVSGQQEWYNTYGGSSRDDAASLLLSNEGHCMMAGYTESIGNGLSDIWVVAVSLDGENTTHKRDRSSVILVSAYPNPFNATATINLIVNESGAFQIDLYNLLGQHMQKTWSGPIAYEQQITFDGSELPSGLYFVRVYQPLGNRVVARQKVVVMK